MNKISLFTENIKFPFNGISKNMIQKSAEKAVTLAGFTNVTLSVILTDNEYIRKINKEYRNKDKETDVISFANRDNAFPPIGSLSEDLGDIFISVDKAMTQSVEYSVKLIDEIKRLLVHGLLHCAGYDHEKSSAGARAMEKREEEILGKL